jgi:hypothetical protein
MGNITNKKALAWIVVIIVLGWVWMSMINKSNTTENGTPAEQTATSSNPVATTTVVNKKTSVALPNQPVSMSYQNALETYKENKRIQLSGTNFCQANPNNVTYKNGTSIMIDNRSAQTHTIKIGSAYTIEGYGFRIIKLSSATLPVTFFMDCDVQQNIAKILLQK